MKVKEYMNELGKKFEIIDEEFNDINILKICLKFVEEINDEKLQEEIETLLKYKIEFIGEKLIK